MLTLASQNPYKSPQTVGELPAKSESPQHPTRMRALRWGVWRGAKFGFWIVAVTFWIPTIVGFGLWLVWTPMDSDRIAKLSSILGTWLLTGLVKIPVAAVVIGSLPGALIMGTVEALSWRPPANLDNSTTVAS